MTLETLDELTTINDELLAAEDGALLDLGAEETGVCDEVLLTGDSELAWLEELVGGSVATQALSVKATAALPKRRVAACKKVMGVAPPIDGDRRCLDV